MSRFGDTAFFIDIGSPLAENTSDKGGRVSETVLPRCSVAVDFACVSVPRAVVLFAKSSNPWLALRQRLFTDQGLDDLAR